MFVSDFEPVRKAFTLVRIGFFLNVGFLGVGFCLGYLYRNIHIRHNFGLRFGNGRSLSLSK